MVNPSRFASDPRIDKPWGSTLREKLPRSVRLRYVNWDSKERQQGLTPFFMTYSSEAVLPFDLDYGAPRVKAFDPETAAEAQRDAVGLLSQR